MILPGLSFLSILLSIATAQCTQLTMACSPSRVVNDGTGCIEVIGVHFVDLTDGSSDLYGGALFITTSSTVLISESTFVACFLRKSSADTFGGGCALFGMTHATVQNSCATRCFAATGQFLLLFSSTKTGHAINSTSLLDCGGSTESDGRQYGVYLYDITATVECLNSTGCSVYEVGAAFGGYLSGASFSSLYLTVCNCSGVSIVAVSDTSAQATVASSNFFGNSVHEPSGVSLWTWGVLTAGF
jgi:hypothetical protein